MIESLLPGVASAEMFSDVPESQLFASEAAIVANACVERRREFGTVRSCAREALQKIGVAAAPILPDTEGTPCWPTGVVGSMTHCRGYRAAAVARSVAVRALGIDAEPDESLPGEVLDLILRPEERVQYREMAQVAPSRHWDTILFCAKEAVFKAWYPITRIWLDFPDLTVSLRPDGRFVAFVHVSSRAGVGPVFPGRWSIGRGLVLAATSVSPLGRETTTRAPRGGGRIEQDCLAEGFA